MLEGICHNIVGGTVEDLREALRLIQENKLAIRTTPIAFDEIPDGLGKLQRGEVVGRLAALMD